VILPALVAKLEAESPVAISSNAMLVDTVAKERVPEPSVLINCPVEPSPVGSVIEVVPNPIASIRTVPSKKASLNSKDEVPRSISLSVEGDKAPSDNVSWFALATLKVTTSSEAAEIVVSASSSKVNVWPLRSTGAVTVPGPANTSYQFVPSVATNLVAPFSIERVLPEAPSLAVIA